MKYGRLHYPGDATARVREGQLLGHDETFRPYVVLDAEYEADADRTVVNLQTASPADLKRETAQ